MSIINTRILNATGDNAEIVVLMDNGGSGYSSEIHAIAAMNSFYSTTWGGRMPSHQPQAPLNTASGSPILPLVYYLGGAYFLIMAWIDLYY